MRNYELDGIALLAAALRTPQDDQNECKLSADEAIGRLCSLMGRVRAHIGGPADCFCPGAHRDPTGYRNDGAAIAFIENAVNEALEHSGMEPNK